MVWPPTTPTHFCDWLRFVDNSYLFFNFLQVRSSQRPSRLHRGSEWSCSDPSGEGSEDQPATPHEVSNVHQSSVCQIQIMAGQDDGHERVVRTCSDLERHLRNASQEVSRSFFLFLIVEYTVISFPHWFSMQGRCASSLEDQEMPAPEILMRHHTHTKQSITIPQSGFYIAPPSWIMMIVRKKKCLLGGREGGYIFRCARRGHSHFRLLQYVLFKRAFLYYYYYYPETKYIRTTPRSKEND